MRWKILLGGVVAALLATGAVAAPYFTNGIPQATPPLTGNERFPADTYLAGSTPPQQESISVANLSSYFGTSILSTANTWSAAQTFPQGDVLLKGSSSGKTTLNSGLSGAGSNTLILPVTASDTLAALGTAETWTAVQTFTDGDFCLKGSSSGCLTLKAPAVASTYVVTFPALTGTALITTTSSPAQGDVLYYSGSAWVSLAVGSNGQLLATQGAAANPHWITASGTGTVTSVICGPTTITAAGTCFATGQIPGSITNDDATAGNIGEYIVGTETGTAYTGAGGAQNLTNVALTAGDWDIEANCIVGIGAASTSQFGCTISTTNSGINTPVGSYIIMPGISNNFSNQAATVGPVRVSLAGNTTYYLNEFVTVTSGSVLVAGVLRARRVR